MLNKSAKEHNRLLHIYIYCIILPWFRLLQVRMVFGFSHFVAFEVVLFGESFGGLLSLAVALRVGRDRLKGHDFPESFALIE